VSRRVSRYACPSGKVRYRNRRACIAGIATQRQFRANLDPDLPPTDLWPYRCIRCNRWHMTSVPQSGVEANTGRIGGQR
jgi:hypothetical protein